MRRRVFLSGDWWATGLDGRDRAGLPTRRTLCGRRGRSCRYQSVQVLGPEASSRSLPLPAPSTADHSSRILYPRPKSLLPEMMNADMDAVDAENQVELEEKTRLINQVLELQHTLEDLSARVDAVKEENLKLKSENQVLGQYIENLMSASSVFQTTDTKSKRK
ncbi:LOW QUALITY PROTEIN: short coiled-coil protein [Ursus maritimus]|uniref:Short coiled-coil protein n=1 Tax=Ursus maritimus TaxID=29073 RepID=A0A384BM42_URSMA|nr:LOW QUALITY PROTEIN: short coiled-coil protein [Ursus maritimus]XP_026355167.2 LOW QUALITY PROTEIN: short coiled-coil protein [Ursus arctos]